VRGYAALMMALAIGSASVPAGAVDLERLVMPGPVISGHEDIEADCDQCHLAFSRDRQRVLCLDCHEDVAADLEARTGFHGLDGAASEQNCAGCHTEHEGRDAQVVQLDTDAFDHKLTDFHLLGAHLETECVDCHAADEKYREAPQACFDCHEEDDEHQGGLGEDCADCHSPQDWEETSFDHEERTDYPLWGGHADVTCTGCHVSYVFDNTPTECMDCHRPDDPHEGLNGNDCAFCHTVDDWEQLLFDHARKTEFPLLGQHNEIACTDCHTGNKFEEPLEQTCVSCHLEDDEHKGRNGPECGDCHTANDWTETTFDHGKTDFPLLGAHPEVACADCHVEPVDKATPPTSCFGCHADDDPHAGQEGEDCGSCHNEQDWQEEVAFEHDLTIFPLIGQHRDAGCGDCHETPQFKDASAECVDCHREDDVHEGGVGLACGDCHNPNDWAFWLFDHATQTSFVLDGAHLQLACETCHTAPLEQQALEFSQCASCHRGDDVHRGEFGRDCARCHNTSTFSGATRQ